MTATPDLEPFQQILASLASGVVALDKDGVIIASNAAARKYLDLGDECLRPGSPLDGTCGAAPFVEVVHRVMSRHEPISRHEFLLPQHEATPKLIGLSASLLQGRDGFNGAIFLFTDITHMRELERAAELNRELAQVGELAAGIVHELRNPLSVILGTVELLLRRLDNGDPRREDVETIGQEAEHLEKAVARILGYARPFELKLERVSPGAIVDRALRLCAQRAEKKRVKIDLRLDQGPPSITADLERASQAVANIVGNAIDAVPLGGEVSIAAHQDESDLIFEILDNGPGIHLRPGDDVFKPFFTMKDGGTGLGLAIVRRIAVAHRGNVTYANRPEGGSRFELRLPIEP